MKKRITRSIRAFSVLAVALTVLLGFTACPPATSTNNGSGSVPFKMIEVPAMPAEGITGLPIDWKTNPAQHNSRKYIGVFIEGRTVILSPFNISNTEITYKLWKEVYDWAIKNGYTFANPGQQGGKWPDPSSGSKPPIEHIGNPMHPVTRVSWRDCIVWTNAYTEKTVGADECVYRSGADNGSILKDATKTIEDLIKIEFMKKSDGKWRTGYRLPTEAEWEYAARYQGSDSTGGVQYGTIYLTKLKNLSGSTKDYDHEEACKEVAWTMINSEVNDEEQTHPVATKKANALGIYDMSGNVEEFCFDSVTTFSTGVAKDPMPHSIDDSRVVKGGDYRHSTFDSMISFRDASSRTDKTYDGQRGFRVASYRKKQ